MVVAGDPELNPAGAAADMPGHGTSGESDVERDARLIALHPGVVTGHTTCASPGPKSYSRPSSMRRGTGRR